MPSDSPDSVPREPHAYAAPVGGDALLVPDSLRVAASTSPVTPGRANAVLVALAVAAFLMVTNEVAPMGLLGPMSESLGRSEAELGLTATLFAVAVMIATLPLALLTTRMIRRWVIVGALGLFTVGTLVAATADGFTELLISRGITGASHALFWAVVTPAAAGMFPLAQRGKSVARLLLGASAAGVFGLPAETYLAQRIGWHAPFWVLAAGGALLAIVVAVLMPSFRTSQATVVRGDHPSGRRFVRIMAVTALTTCGMTLTWTYISPFVTEVAGFADATVPVLLFVGGFVGVVTTWVVARYLDRFPVRSVAVGQVLLVAMWAGLTVAGASKPVVVVMIALQGLAWSVLVAAMVNWALRHSPWTVDIGNGVYAILFNSGNAIGSRVGAMMLGAWGAQWLPAASLVLVTGALVLVLTTPRERVVPA